jgi:hypothetical protein
VDTHKIVIIKNNYKINKLIKNINLSKIGIKKIVYNGIYKIELYSKNKKDIYKFLSLYKHSVKLNYLIKDKNRYFMEVELAL